MTALFGISLWITLATVLPGLVTIFLLLTSFAVLQPTLLDSVVLTRLLETNLGTLAGAVTVMIFTQMLGILVERVWTRFPLYGPTMREIDQFRSFEADQTEKDRINVYDVYRRGYNLLAVFGRDDDVHGHIKRVLAQFFLTNNVMTAVMIALAVSIAICVADRTLLTGVAIGYFCVLVLLLGIAWFAGGIRIKTMAIALRVARMKYEAAEREQQARSGTGRQAHAQDHEED